MEIRLPALATPASHATPTTADIMMSCPPNIPQTYEKPSERYVREERDYEELSSPSCHREYAAPCQRIYDMPPASSFSRNIAAICLYHTIVTAEGERHVIAVYHCVAGFEAPPYLPRERAPARPPPEIFPAFLHRPPPAADDATLLPNASSVERPTSVMLVSRRGLASPASRPPRHRRLPALTSHRPQR